MATEREEVEENAAEAAARVLETCRGAIGTAFGDIVTPQVAALQAAYQIGAEIVRALGRQTEELRLLREQLTGHTCGHGSVGLCMYCVRDAIAQVQR